MVKLLIFLVINFSFARLLFLDGEFESSASPCFPLKKTELSVGLSLLVLLIGGKTREAF
jgi:hypothetical protein